LSRKRKINQGLAADKGLCGSKMQGPDKTNPAGGQGQSSKAATGSAVARRSRVNTVSVRLEVALAQRDVTRAGSGNLAAQTLRDLLDLATTGQKACGLFLDRKAGKVISRGKRWFGFAVLGSSHMILSLALSIFWK
jgi:hypothetical protein